MPANTGNFEETMSFDVRKEEELNPSDVLKAVYAALREKGYNPINQLVGYLISVIRLILPAISRPAALFAGLKEMSL